MSISFNARGSFKNTEAHLRGLLKLDIQSIFEKAGRDGVTALKANIPTDTGLAAASWGYSIKKTNTGISIIWTNIDIEKGFPVAIMLQYGYATGTGGYVQGRDYINPAMKPIFDKILDDIRRAVRSA